jgi:hypothetical protein
MVIIMSLLLTGLFSFWSVFHHTTKLNRKLQTFAIRRLKSQTEASVWGNNTPKSKSLSAPFEQYIILPLFTSWTRNH